MSYHIFAACPFFVAVAISPRYCLDMAIKKDYTKLLDTRRILFDVRLLSERVTYINVTGARASDLVAFRDRKNVVITPKVAR